MSLVRLEPSQNLNAAKRFGLFWILKDLVSAFVCDITPFASRSLLVRNQSISDVVISQYHEGNDY